MVLISLNKRQIEIMDFSHKNAAFVKPTPVYFSMILTLKDGTYDAC